MDLKFIRIKRVRSIEPEGQIALSAKRLKNNGGGSVVTKIATLHSMDEPLEEVVKEAIAKIREQHESKNKEDFSQLYKNNSELQQRATKARAKATKEQKEGASASRYRIISKARGLAEIDADTLDFISKSDSFSLKLDDSKSSANENVEASSKEAEKEPSAKAANNKMDIEVIDVHDSTFMDEDEDICVNGEPMVKVKPKRFVYDLYLATGPKNCLDGLNIIEPPSFYTDYDACDSDVDYDSEDSNAEYFDGNDYPDMEMSDNDFDQDDVCHQNDDSDQNDDDDCGPEKSCRYYGSDRSFDINDYNDGLYDLENVFSKTRLSSSSDDSSDQE